ncbi:hypothetical protein HMPREF2531_01850 [Bacteroides intestinalis]|uniref:Uncharacterized protein n=1 Tax=Bacteroides intestinalis TaxID=329854 RepID=A0A139LJH5_9BACE|nr:hypothetical protein HMPREF2531_01850 [Bacteroides intestinalis]
MRQPTDIHKTKPIVSCYFPSINIFLNAFAKIILSIIKTSVSLQCG